MSGGICDGAVGAWVGASRVLKSIVTKIVACDEGEGTPQRITITVLSMFGRSEKTFPRSGVCVLCMCACICYAV